MKRTTLFLHEETDQELRALARRKGLPIATLVRDALGRYLAELRRHEGLQLKFLVVGRSGHRHTSERAETLLWRDLAPHSPGARRAARRRE